MTTLSAVLFAAAAMLFPACRSAAAQEPDPDITGLWAAKGRFGPDIRGPLLLLRAGDGWRADVAGFSMPVRVDGPRVSIELPDGKGSFRGKLDGRAIVGHWIGQPTYHSRLAYATPVVLGPDGPNRWRGKPILFAVAFTFYLPVTRRADDTYAAYLRNPERNQGRFIPVSSIELKGDVIALVGRSDSQAD